MRIFNTSYYWTSTEYSSNYAWSTSAMATSPHIRACVTPSGPSPLFTFNFFFANLFALKLNLRLLAQVFYKHNNKEINKMIERLQIYKDSYTLTTRIYDSLPQMARIHKHTLGARLLDSSLEMFKWISLANKSWGQQRVEMLDSFFVCFEQLRVYLKICSDNKIIKLTSLVEMFKLIGNISRQLSGWRSATATRAQR